MALISRYQKRKIKRNRSPEYEDFLNKRNLNFVKHYNTETIVYPTKEEIQALKVISKTWSIGDRYEKLASKYYGDPELWWVIATFNKKPAEFLLSPGDIIHIPTPLEYALDYMGY